MRVDLSEYKKESIVYFPIRHHSLSSAKFVKIAIEQFRPDSILIEGPSDASHLIENIAKSKMPVSIYGKIENEEVQVGVNFPFFDTSPEYIGIEEGFRKRIKTQFIDIPMYDSKILKEKKINFEYSQYITEVVKKSGLKSFDEYYEKYFEIGLIGKSIDKYMEQMLTYCKITRELTPSNEYNDLRETYMARKIIAYRGQRTLVITGGFHSVVLPKLVSEIECGIKSGKMQEPIIKKNQQNKNYLIPYNVQNISSLNGYSAGICYPYYQKILLKNKVEPRDTFVELLRMFAKKTKREVSMPKLISGVELAYGLASLREKKYPGVYELFDAATSVFTEFHQYDTTQKVLSEYKEFLIGDAYGKVYDMSHLPPIVEDFHRQIEKHKFIKPNTTYVLQVLNNRSAYKRSVFLSKLAYLSIPFGTKVKGLDIFHIDIADGINQIYKISSKEMVMPYVIEVAFLGGSIDKAVEAKIGIKAKEATSLKGLTECLKDAVVLQIEDKRNELSLMVKKGIAEENNIFDLANAFYEMIRIADYYETFVGTKDCGIDGLVKELYIKLMVAFHTLEELHMKDEEKLAKVMQEIYALLHRSIYQHIDQKLYFATLKKLMKKRWTTALKGLSLSILYTEGHIEEKELLRCIENNVILSEVETKGTIVFLTYLLGSNYQLLLNNENFLEVVNRFVHNMETEEFLKILPYLRKIFMKLRPLETIKLSEDLTRLQNETENFLVQFSVSEEEFLRNQEMERCVLMDLKAKGIV